MAARTRDLSRAWLSRTRRSTPVADPSRRRTSRLRGGVNRTGTPSAIGAPALSGGGGSPTGGSCTRTGNSTTRAWNRAQGGSPGTGACVHGRDVRRFEGTSAEGGKPVLWDLQRRRQHNQMKRTDTHGNGSGASHPQTPWRELRIETARNKRRREAPMQKNRWRARSTHPRERVATRRTRSVAWLGSGTGWAGWGPRGGDGGTAYSEQLQSRRRRVQAWGTPSSIRLIQTR